MSNPYKKLGGQALVYGLGNIVPRLLNYAVLTVYFTRRFPPERYGVITELYAYVAIFLVILTYGMETGLFKFSTGSEKKEVAYTTVLTCIVSTSLLFALIVFVFRNIIAEGLDYPGNSDYIVYLGFTLSLDAIAAIIFAKLRIENKVRKFAGIKILNVITTIFFVFLFLEILPAIPVVSGSWWYIKYLANVEVGYVFIANLLSSGIVLLLLLAELKGIRFIYDKVLLKKILTYSIPLLFVGLAGIFNEFIDRILLKHFLPDSNKALYELGIYGANYRIAVLMTIFVQMFRYAAEPFFFNQSENKNSEKVYGNVFKYFTFFLMLIFLTVGLGIDFFKLFIDKDYYEGLSIVPIVLLANVLVGMLFNVNMWYKLSGHTIYGIYITGLGAFITIVLNILFIPRYGYIACAWIHLLSNAVMLVVTYFFGQKMYKIDYNLKEISFYVFLGLVFYVIGYALRSEYTWLNLIIGVIFVFLYFVIGNKKEHLIDIFLRKNES